MPVIPLGIVKGGRLCQDGVDITTADAVNAADYEALFREMAARYD